MTEQNAMTEQRFRQILAAYGANPSHWPEEEHDAAMTYLQAHPSAQQELEDEARLDRLMDRLPNPGISEAALNTVLNIPTIATQSQAKDRIAEIFIGWRPFAGLSSALACGLIVGLLLGPINNDFDDNYDVIDASGLTAVGTILEEQ